MSALEINDCFRHDGRPLRHAEAIGLLNNRMLPVASAGMVSLPSALGRIVAASISAGCNVPPHTNAAVDGYAFSSRDYDPAKGSCLLLAGRSAAGAPFIQTVGPGEAVRILTGAVVPAGLDMVAMQEDCQVAADDSKVKVTLPSSLKPGVNIRRAGEDVRIGDEIFPAGHLLRPQDLAALSSLGVAEVACYRPLRISIVSTGDEVIRPGTSKVPVEGSVYDANQPMLAALAALAGGEVRDAGIWPDDRRQVTDGLAALAPVSDVILTSGGASRGDGDHMAAALEALGTCHFWQIDIKPGRPLMLGQIGSTVVVGLPGNPVAVFVCFLVYVWPMLRALSGAGWREPARMPARASFAFANRKRGRREFWRGTLSFSADGIRVDKFRRDGSGLISGLRAANCLIEIPEDAGDIAMGDTVAVIPFTEFGILDG